MGSGSVKKGLLKLSKTRTAVVTISGDDESPSVEVLVREVGASEFAEYGELIKEAKAKKVSREGATAFLLSICIVEQTDAGLVPVYTSGECLDIARSARVSMPIMNRIMELSGFAEDDKPGEPVAS